MLKKLLIFNLTLFLAILSLIHFFFSQRKENSLVSAIMWSCTFINLVLIKNAKNYQNSNDDDALCPYIKHLPPLVPL